MSGRHRRRTRRSPVAALTVLLAGACLIVSFGGNTVARVVSGSMQPTLYQDDRIVVHVTDTNGLHAGDIVAVRAPAGSVAQTPIIVKRIVATAGSTVACCINGHLVVNGVPVTETYLASPDVTTFGPFTVPASHVFLLGDHRSASEDSRTFGAVPGSEVLGTVSAIVWPPSRFTLSP